MSVFESYWANKAACDDAERTYYEKLSGCKFSEEEDAEEATEAPEEAVPAAVKPAAASAPKRAVVAEPSQPAEAEQQLEAELAKNPGAFKNAANGERTFIMCKPDAVQRGLVGEIVERFEQRGFRLLAAKLMQAPEPLLREHYADLSKKGFFPELIRYMGSGPVVPMVWQGLGAVRQGRVLLGATNPKDSAPGTIRGDLCIDVGRNIIHGSDSVAAAEKEIGLWFLPEEVASWRSAETEWVYEEEELEPALAPVLAPAPAPAPATIVDGLVSSAGSSEDMALVKKLNALEVENKQLKKVTDDLKALVLSLEARVGQLEGPPKAAAPAPVKAAAAKPADDDDDDVDLFGSSDEEESEEKKRITEERLKAYNEKKSKKPKVIAKTSVLLDVKPWDDETDHAAMLASVKSIEMDGLTWGASKLVPIGYGIKKLQVMCTVEDDKVSVEELSEKIEEFEDFVQSCDVSAMNKI